MYKFDCLNRLKFPTDQKQLVLKHRLAVSNHSRHGFSPPASLLPFLVQPLLFNCVHGHLESNCDHETTTFWPMSHKRKDFGDSQEVPLKREEMQYFVA